MIVNLFGHLCSGTSFSYDEQMRINGKNKTALPLDCNSPQYSSVRERDSSPVQVTRALESDPDPTSGPPTSGQPQSTHAIPTEATRRPTKQAKCQVTVRTSPRKRVRKELTRRVSFALREDHVVGASSSGWLNPSDNEPGQSKSDQMISMEAHRSHATNTTIDGGRGKEPSPSHADGSQRKSRMHDATYREPAEDRENSSISTPANESKAKGSEPLGSDGGTQLRPIELSDTSGSETEDNEEKELDARSIKPGDDLTGVETQLSATDSMFESQEMRSSNAPRKKNLARSRIQYRKEIYEQVKDDDGHAWGKDYGLLSTAIKDEDDYSEEL